MYLQTHHHNVTYKLPLFKNKVTSSLFPSTTRLWSILDSGTVNQMSTSLQQLKNKLSDQSYSKTGYLQALIQKYISRWVAGLGFKLSLSYKYHEYYHNRRIYSGKLNVDLSCIVCKLYSASSCYGVWWHPHLEKFENLRSNLEILMKL